MYPAADDTAGPANDIDLVEAGNQRDPPAAKTNDTVLFLESHSDPVRGSSVNQHAFRDVNAFQSFLDARGEPSDVGVAQEQLIFIDARVFFDPKVPKSTRGRTYFNTRASYEEELCSWLHRKGLPYGVLHSISLREKLFRPGFVRTADDRSMLVWYKTLDFRMVSEDQIALRDAFIAKMSTWGILMPLLHSPPQLTESPFLASRRCLLLYPSLSLCILVCPGDSIAPPNTLVFNEPSPSEVVSLQQDLSTSLQEWPGHGLFYLVLARFQHAMIEDENDVLHGMKFVFDWIERAMANDYEIRRNISELRSLIGQWRSHLYRLSEQLEAMKMMLPAMRDHLAGYRNEKIELFHEPKISSVDHLSAKLAMLESNRQALLSRCDSTFSALMATMSILESQKAIAQAEEVTKLTQLAFVFIPLTFVAGIFGMNLEVYWQSCDL